MLPLPCTVQGPVAELSVTVINSMTTFTLLACGLINPMRSAQGAGHVGMQEQCNESGTYRTCRRDAYALHVQILRMSSSAAVNEALLS